MDPVVAVYDTATGGRLATADDVSPSDSSSRLTLPLSAGRRYTLAVTSFDTATVGPYDVAIRAALEDDIREDDDAPVRGVATRIPQPENASFSGVRAVWPGPATTRSMGRPNFLANSKSRSSCPGTAMIAPVP